MTEQAVPGKASPAFIQTPGNGNARTSVCMDENHGRSVLRKKGREKMKKNLAALLVIMMCCLLAVLPAAAADVFMYEDRSVTIFEGDTVHPVILRDGRFAGDGTISFTVNNKKVCSVDADGAITAGTRGTAIVTATLNQNGKAVKRTTIQVTVARRVTKVTLSTKNLQIFEPDDEEILQLLQRYLKEEEKNESSEADEKTEEDPEQEPEEERLTDRILVIPAGKTVLLSTTCTPEDATSKKIAYETDDAGVAKIINTRELRAVQRGACRLTVRSVQNPEITENFMVLVIEPVKKVTIEAPFNNVSTGSSMQLDAVFTPSNATIQKVTWSSRSPKIATVDENGIVTGLTKGRVTIDAKAEDGSGAVGSITLNITQDVTEISITQSEVTVATQRNVQLKFSVLPQSASDRTVTWSSSDQSVARVRNGTVTGVRAGECIITCTSNSNPGVTASIPVTVIQLVTKITFRNQTGLSFHVNTSQQLEWDVWPEDATETDVTFRSLNPKIATVDQNGLVTGISRGQAKIVATATDGSNRQGTFVVTITQPVESIEIPQETYYAQVGRALDIRPVILPKNANNQRVSWSCSSDRIADVRTVGTNVGRVTGWRRGTAVLTATTEDGGFTASTEVIVDNFDAAVMIEGANIDKNNKIRLTLRNTGDFTVKGITFRVQCFDTQAEPMICNRDGESTWFDGSYAWEVEPGDRTEHGQFNFKQYLETGTLGYIIVTVTGYEFENGQKWSIPTDEWVPYQSPFSSHMWENMSERDSPDGQGYYEEEEDD